MNFTDRHTHSRYLILPVAFTGPNENPSPPVDRSAIITAALTLIAFAYVLSFGVGFIQRRNGPFVIQHVFLYVCIRSILPRHYQVLN